MATVVCKIKTKETAEPARFGFSGYLYQINVPPSGNTYPRTVQAYLTDRTQCMFPQDVPPGEYEVRVYNIDDYGRPFGDSVAAPLKVPEVGNFYAVATVEVSIG